MDDHHFLASASRKFGLHYSRAGNGICHQVNLERFSVPGETLLGADSHTTMAGAGHRCRWPGYCPCHGR
jgi:aconitate hydratase